MKRLLVTVAAPAAVLVAAASASAAAPVCPVSSLPLVKKGTLTIGTDNPAYPPWFGGGEKNKPWQINDPSTGKGYESAVAYAVAAKLGFSRAQVSWTPVPFLKSFAPGKKPFDLFINQVSYSPERAKNVDFSSSYYNVNQAIVVRKGTPIAKVKKIAGLKRFQLGAMVGTTSLQVITDRIQPSTKPRVYDNNADAVNALKQKQVDGLVVDLPTAFYVTAAQVPGSTILGQFPKSAGAGEYFGMVLQKDSGLTTCVNKALGQLRAGGTLAKLEKKWLGGAQAPTLK